MKILSLRSTALLAGIFFTTSLRAEMTEAIAPKPVLDVMQRVADWQIANPSKHKPTDWTCGAGDAGMMALVGISGDAKYRDAMLASPAPCVQSVGLCVDGCASCQSATRCITVRMDAGLRSSARRVVMSGC